MLSQQPLKAAEPKILSATDSETNKHWKNMNLQKKLIPVCIAALLCVPAFSAQQSQVKPNIILVMADDLGWKELGSYGQTKIRTPHLDKMAKEGMRFTQFYAGAPVCGPTRCNLMTGKHAGHAVIRANGEIRSNEHTKNGATIFGGQTPLPSDEITIAEVLKSKGYATGCFGKWGLGIGGSTGDPLKKGFDRFYGYNCQRHAHNYYPKYLNDDDTLVFLEGNTREATGKHYAPQLIADEMLKFVKKNRNKPFFVYYPTTIPHTPLQIPEKEIEAYSEWNDGSTKGKNRAIYAAMVSFMDKQMGRLFAQLKELNIDDNTIVLFTSDNGTTFLGAVDHRFFNSVGELRGLKGSVYEGGIREPLIARWPGKIPKGTTSDHISALYDLAETCAQVAQTKMPKNTDGISLLPTFLGKLDKQETHEFLIWDFAERYYGGQVALRMGDWKGLKRKMLKNPDAALQLYNLKDDPNEKNDVARKHPEIVAEIEKLILQERDRPKLKKFQFGTYRD